MFLSVALALAAVRPAAAQMAGMPGMADMQPVPPPEQLPAPIKMTGIGNSHIAIKASPEAQAWFDQGLSLLHDFWDYESAKAFEQAIRVDPNCAMCYWGLSRAVDSRGEEAEAYGKKALAKAVELEGHAGAAGKLYIEAAQAASVAKDDDRTAEIAILRKLVKKNPSDIEARIFLAGAVGDGYDDKGEPKPGQKERIAILESVIKDAPNDSAAQPLLDSRHGAQQSSGSGPEKCGSAGQPCAQLRPHGAHAGTHLLSLRQLR